MGRSRPLTIKRALHPVVPAKAIAACSEKRPGGTQEEPAADGESMLRDACTGPRARVDRRRECLTRGWAEVPEWVFCPRNSTTPNRGK